jgi:hypothetical protein
LSIIVCGGFGRRVAVLRNKGVNIAVRDTRIGNNPEQGADRMGIAFCNQNPSEHAVYRRVPNVDDLVRLHLKDFIAFSNSITLTLIPGGDGPLDHLDTPLGDSDWINIAHKYAPGR